MSTYFAIECVLCLEAVYYPKNVLRLNEADTFYIDCNHDEYSLFFDVLAASGTSDSNIPVGNGNGNGNGHGAYMTIQSFIRQESVHDDDDDDDDEESDSDRQKKTKSSATLSNETRSLGVTLVSRNRLAQLNDVKRNAMFLQVLRKV